MFLKQLTMKGFKSFADDTVLDFEPGVTAVVGPNGSGKSNVVDAVAWVLGAQSARAMRSAKMEDVIFSGTARRAALGRCEVSLTLDNSSGLLPIETAEVTTTRVRFAEKGDLPGAAYVLAKLAAEILALPARVSGRGHDMLAYLRKPITVTA